MAVTLSLSTVGLIIYWLLLTTVFLRVVFKRRPVSSSLAWMLIIVFLPFLGIVLYFLFGEVQLGKRRAERAQALRDPFIQNLSSHLIEQQDDQPTSTAAKAVYEIMQQHMGRGSIGYDNLQVFSAPDEIFDAWLTDIRSAKKNIRACFYIWHDQGRVKEVAQALIEAAQRGVEIEILVDHAGSWSFFMFSKQLDAMRSAGIEFVAALPVSLWRNIFRRIDLRMHRKLLIIDNKIGYGGSMNMADPRFFNSDRKVGPWIDMMMRFEGAAAFGVSKVFSWDWEVETGERRFPVLEKEIAQLPTTQWMTMVPSGPDLGTDVITQVMLTSIYRAEKCITVATPYFVPSESLLLALCHAAERGVEVIILLPKKCDSKLAGWASKSFYSDILRAGAEIRHFNKGLLHTKALVVDEQIAIVGSVNLDVRSFQLNFELSFALYNESSCGKIISLLNQYSENSEVVRYEDWERRGRLSRLYERLTFFVSPLL